MATLLELEKLPDVASLRAHCELMGGEDELLSREKKRFKFRNPREAIYSSDAPKGTPTPAPRL
jgi:hypothetical protein